MTPTHRRALTLSAIIIGAALGILLLAALEATK